MKGRKDQIVSGEEAAALIAALSEADRALWATALYAGLRLGELRALRWEDVDLASGKPRQNVKSWHKLERALLLAFREMYGDPPKHNTHGKKMRETNEFDLFVRSRLKSILKDIGE